MNGHSSHRITLFESKTCLVTCDEETGFISALCFERLSPALHSLLGKWRVSQLELKHSPQDTLHFLKALPDLVLLSLELMPGKHQLNFCSHPSLRSLRLRVDDFELVEIAMNARALGLREVKLPFCTKLLDGICLEDIEKIALTGPGEQNLDLKRAGCLTELQLLGNRSLRTIVLAEESRLSSMEIAQCPKLIIDWLRIGRDLEQLRIEGPLKSSPSPDCPLTKLIRLNSEGLCGLEPSAFLATFPALKYFLPIRLRMGAKVTSVLDVLAERRSKDLEK